MGTIARVPRALLARRAAVIIHSQEGRWQGGFRSLALRVLQLLAGLLIVWQKRLRDRDALQRMNPAQLADIGIDREDALREAEKPFWRR